MYPELSKFYRFIEEQELSVSFSGIVYDELLEVSFKSKDKEWKLYVENEYDDFDINNQPICIYLVLRALDDFRIEGDYKSWTGYFSLNPNDPHWKAYYEYLFKTYVELENAWGSVETFIKDEDYLMCEGAYVELLKSQN